MGLKGLKYNYIEILSKNFVGCLFKRIKTSNEDILRLYLSESFQMIYCTCQWHVCSLSYHHSNFMSHMSDFEKYTFSLQRMDFSKIFFTSEDRY